MAIYSTFFLCEPKDLLAGLPGWRLPLERPVKREFINPFTREKTVVETREPEWSEEEAEPASVHAQVVSEQGNYQEYLESRLSPFVRGLPHWAGKGLTSLELEPLFHALGVETEMSAAMYSPPSLDSMLEQVPPEFLPAMRTTDLTDLSRQWAAAMSTPDHTHSATGQRLSDGWKPDEAFAILQPLADLARNARPRPGQQMFLLTEM
jgi:hypothetical protein